MSCTYKWILPQAQEQFYWSSSRPWCCGPWYKEGKGCLIQCSTFPNITCITGQYDYTCPGHIHWGLVYFAVTLAFNCRIWPKGNWWCIKSQSGTWKFSFRHEDVILLRGLNANLGIEYPNWIKGWPTSGPGVTDYNPGQSWEASKPLIQFVSKLIGLPDQFCFKCSLSVSTYGSEMRVWSCWLWW